MKHQIGPIVRRMSVVLGLVVIWAAMTSVISPERSRAMQDGSAEFPFSSEGNPVLIGELAGVSYRVQIHAADPEPVYSVLKMDGTTMAAGLTSAEMALQFPGLPILCDEMSDTTEPSLIDGIRTSDTPMEQPSVLEDVIDR